MMNNPSAKEQYMLELINRMRMNPDAEYDLLVNSTNEDIQTGLSIVDLDVLKSQWNQLKPVQPLAWSNQLHLSAVNHTQLMIDNNAQKHNFPGEPSISERIANTGYEATTQTENIYAFGSSVLESHAAFAIDWGDDDNNLGNGKGTGIQNPPSHRDAIMSNEYREVGIGILREDTSGTKVSKLFTTQHFANSKELSETNTSWLLGTVFRDIDNDDFYSV
ncbi:MAG: CAP domain-containing protein, partial [Cyanobacteria bacterium J06649_11]